MEKVIVSLVVCIAVLVGLGIFGWRAKVSNPEFRAYRRYINNSRKIKSQDVINGMVAAAGVIEALEHKMGTLALALALADGDIRPVGRDGYGGFVDGASLILNKLDELIDCKNKYGNCSLRFLVTSTTKEIESVIRQEYSKA